VRERGGVLRKYLSACWSVQYWSVFGALGGLYIQIFRAWQLAVRIRFSVYKQSRIRQVFTVLVESLCSSAWATGAEKRYLWNYHNRTECCIVLTRAK
jgi:hypothetical protein